MTRRTTLRLRRHRHIDPIEGMTIIGAVFLILMAGGIAVVLTLGAIR